VSEADAPDEPAWRDLVRDELRSLRTSVLLLGVLGVVALGIAVWALVDDDSGGGPSDVSPTRVVALERRVDDLRSDVAQPSDAVASLRARQEALEQQIAALSDRLRQRAERTNAELRLIEDRLDELERGAPTPTPTPAP
jgi:TolA-binding protein